jgi:Zn-dependent protease
MAREPDSSATPPPVSPDRLWAEQLAIGMALLLALLIFMALEHWTMLSSGGKIFGPNYVGAYGWMSAIAIFAQLILHEAATLIVAWRLKLPLRFRPFVFGANATAILENQPRQPWTDARVGLAGPVAGTIACIALALTSQYLKAGQEQDGPDQIWPFFLGMACVGYFYNLFTLIPILDLEGGWIASAIAPEAWFVGLVLTALELTKQFNLVLLGVLCFAVPRFVLLIRARAPRLDLGCTPRQRMLVAVVYFVLVLGLAWFASTTFEYLASAVPEAMSD